MGSTARLVSWLAAGAGPVVGDEDRVGPDRRDDLGRQRDLAAPRRDGDQVAVGDTERLGEPGVHLAERFGVLGDEPSDASGLGAGQVLADDPPGGQPDGVLVVDDLGRLLERHTVEAGLAVGMEEPASLVQPGCAGVADLGDRPEQAHLVGDALPGGPVVVGRATLGGEAQLFEDLLGVVVRKYRPRPSRAARSSRICQSRRASPGGSTAALILMIRPSPLVEVPSSSSCSEPGEHDIGVLRRFGQEEVDDGVELEPVEGFGGEVGVGCRHGGVEADRQQSLDLTGVDRLDDLLGRDALARDLLVVATPHRCDVGAVFRVRDVAVAGQLVAFVAVLTAALAVALPGDRRYPASRLAELPGRQTKVDGREHVVDTLGVLLDTVGVEQHPGGRRAPPLGGLFDARAGTPVIPAAQRVVMSSTPAAASAKPTVWASMNSWSSQSLRISSRSTAPNRAESVPGRTPRNRSAVRANGTTRGSCTIRRAPRSRARHT